MVGGPISFHRAVRQPPPTGPDESGATVRSESRWGQALVVSFVFTSCVGACPLITAQLARAQVRARSEKLDGRLRFVSITLDPRTDTPDVLRRYADAYGTEGRIAERRTDLKLNPDGLLSRLRQLLG
jgi:cytochrome oxidase Cu insertion factor (SCO1/SenC/PrrC family)